MSSILLNFYKKGLLSPNSPLTKRGGEFINNLHNITFDLTHQSYS